MQFEASFTMGVNVLWKSTVVDNQTLLIYSHLSPDSENHQNIFFQVEQLKIDQLELIFTSQFRGFVDIRRFWVLKIWQTPKTADKSLEKNPINSFQYNVSDYVFKIV